MISIPRVCTLIIFYARKDSLQPELCWEANPIFGDIKAIGQARFVGNAINHYVSHVQLGERIYLLDDAKSSTSPLQHRRPAGQVPTLETPRIALFKREQSAPPSNTASLERRQTPEIAFISEEFPLPSSKSIPLQQQPSNPQQPPSAAPTDTNSRRLATPPAAPREAPTGSKAGISSSALEKQSSVPAPVRSASANRGKGLVASVPSQAANGFVSLFVAPSEFSPFKAIASRVPQDPPVGQNKVMDLEAGEHDVVQVPLMPRQYPRAQLCVEAIVPTYPFLICKKKKLDETIVLDVLSFIGDMHLDPSATFLFIYLLIQ